MGNKVDTSPAAGDSERLREAVRSWRESYLIGRGCFVADEAIRQLDQILAGGRFHTVAARILSAVAYALEYEGYGDEAKLFHQLKDGCERDAIAAARTKEG